MRWLVVAPGPGFSVADVHIGWCEALRDLGETVAEFPLGDVMTFYDAAHIVDDTGEMKKALDKKQVLDFTTDRLAAALYKYRPHVLLSVSTFFTDPQLLQQARSTGTKTVLLMTESPYETDRELAIAPYADLVLLNDPTHIDKFRAVTQATYAPHAYRRNIHRPGPLVPHLACDLSFVGTGFPSRVEFFEAMNLDGLTVRLAGSWVKLEDDSPLRPYLMTPRDECFDNVNAVPLYRSTKVGINLYRQEANAEQWATGWSMGPREVEQAACGLFYIRDPRGEGDEVFSMLPTFTSPSEASELVRWWAGHEELRVEAARQARQAVADRTFHNHAAKLLRLFDRQPVPV